MGYCTLSKQEGVIIQEGTPLIYALNGDELSLTEELNVLTQNSRGAYLVELSSSMEIAENEILDYRSCDYKQLSNGSKDKFIKMLLFAHDYLLEKVKYLEEERFKNA